MWQTKSLFQPSERRRECDNLRFFFKDKHYFGAKGNKKLLLSILQHLQWLDDSEYGCVHTDTEHVKCVTWRENRKINETIFVGFSWVAFNLKALKIDKQRQSSSYRWVKRACFLTAHAQLLIEGGKTCDESHNSWESCHRWDRSLQGRMWWALQVSTSEVSQREKQSWTKRLHTFILCCQGKNSHLK